MSGSGFEAGYGTDFAREATQFRRAFASVFQIPVSPFRYFFRLTNNRGIVRHQVSNVRTDNEYSLESAGNLPGPPDLRARRLKSATAKNGISRAEAVCQYKGGRIRQPTRAVEEFLELHKRLPKFPSKAEYDDYCRLYGRTAEKELARFDIDGCVQSSKLLSGADSAARRMAVSRVLRTLAAEGLISRPDRFHAKLTDAGRERLAQMQGAT